MIQSTSKLNSILCMSFALIFVLFFIACGEDTVNETKTLPKEVKQVVPVEVQILSKGTFQTSQIFFAEAHPIDIGQLISSSGGQVKIARAENGERVKKGQKLCDIDAAIHRTALELSIAQQGLAETEYSRQEQHLASTTGSKVMLDQAKVKLLLSKQAQLVAQKTYNEAICAAPISGRVGAKYIQSNQTISPGSATYTLVNSNSIKLHFGVSENLIREYSKGSQVLVTLNNGHQVKAKINYLAAIIDPQTRTFQAEIRMMNPKKHPVQIGESIKVQVFGKKRLSQWVIPNSSILNFAKSNAIMIAEDNKSIKKEIVISSSNQTHSQITGDIKEGDLLIITNQHRLANGSLLRIKEFNETTTILGATSK